MPDETREFLYHRRIQQQQGEYVGESIPVEETLTQKARTIRLFYDALLREDFSEQIALHIILNNPIYGGSKNARVETGN